MEERTMVDREGIFRTDGFTATSLFESEKSKAIGVNVSAMLTHMWDRENKAWIDWNYGQEADGTVWIDKADGTSLDRNVEALVKYAGWDGDLNSAANFTFKPTPCQVTVTAKVYKPKNGPEQTTYEISFINDYNRVPGEGMPKVDPNRARELANQHNSKYRAIAANVKRNGTAPATSKPAPPPANGAKGMGVPASQTAAAMAHEKAVGDDGIPF